MSVGRIVPGRGQPDLDALLLREEGEHDGRIVLDERLDDGRDVGLTAASDLDDARHRRAPHSGLVELRHDEAVPEQVQLPRHPGQRDHAHGTVR